MSEKSFKDEVNDVLFAEMCKFSMFMGIPPKVEAKAGENPGDVIIDISLDPSIAKKYMEIFGQPELIEATITINKD